MCRAIYIKNLKKSPDKNLFGIVLNYVSNSYNAFNRDGYFIKHDFGELKTLSYKQFINFIIKGKNEINSSSEILIHLRMATHGRGEKWIHGWELNNWICYHNGIIEHKNQRIENDSYDFFSNVTEGDNIKENVEKELKKRNGGGAFFLIDNLTKNRIIASKNHQINVHLLNDSIIAINSNDDIHNFDEEVEIEDKKNKEKWGFNFETSFSYSINTGLKIDSDFSSELRDCIITIGDKGVTNIENLSFNNYYLWDKQQDEKDEERWQKYEEEWIERERTKQEKLYFG